MSFYVQQNASWGQKGEARYKDTEHIILTLRKYKIPLMRI